MVNRESGGNRAVRLLIREAMGHVLSFICGELPVASGECVSGPYPAIRSTLRDYNLAPKAFFRRHLPFTLLSGKPTCMRRRQVRLTSPVSSSRASCREGPGSPGKTSSARRIAPARASHAPTHSRQICSSRSRSEVIPSFAIARGLVWLCFLHRPHSGPGMPEGSGNDDGRELDNSGLAIGTASI